MKMAEASAELTLEALFEMVQPELSEVEDALRQGVRSAVPIVDEINKYIHDSGGKRLRPTLTLLCSRLLDYRDPALVQLGVILELIHVASLVHDDIIDNSRTRRGKPAVHSHWGNQVTVLMGDWLYMTSFQMALGLKEMQVIHILIGVTRQLVEGELLQLQYNGSLDITRSQQLTICKRKTADLFASCGKLAAVMAELGSAIEDKLWEYGESLGMAFQLVDDLLDYTASEKAIGKPVLKDLEEGKVTLPIIYLMERADRKDVRFLRSAMKNRDFGARNKERIIAMAEAHNALSDVRREAEDYAQQAREALSEFSDSIHRRALLQLTQFVLDRKR